MVEVTNGKELFPLPDTWTWVSLSNIATVGSHQVLPFNKPDQLFNYLALENIESGTGRIINFSPSLGREIKSNKFIFDREDLLYGKLRPYLRKVVAPDFEGISATDLLPIKPDCKRLSRKYLKWWLLSPAILDYVTGKQTGVKMPRLRSNDLDNLPVPLPSINEQIRIVSKLESLDKQVHTVRTALERIPPLLKAFRQSVLAAAFRGELTERDPGDEPAEALLERIRAERRRKWEESLRAKGKDPAKYTYEEPAAPDTSNLPKLPQGWVWTTLEEISWDSGYGTSQKCGYEHIGPPVIRIPNILNGKLDFEDLKYATLPEDLQTSEAISGGDLLIVRTNGSKDLIGKITFISNNLEKQFYFASYLIRYRLVSHSEIGDWVASLWDAPFIRDQVERMAASSAGQYNLSVAKLNRLILPLSPLTVQKRSNEKINFSFHQLDIIQKYVHSVSRRLDELEQATLSKAFRGEL